MFTCWARIWLSVVTGVFSENIASSSLTVPGHRDHTAIHLIASVFIGSFLRWKCIIFLSYQLLPLRCLPNFFPTSGRFSFGSTFMSSLRVPVYPLSATKEFCILVYLASERCSLTTACLASKTLRVSDKQALSGDAEECRRSHLCISYWVRISTFYLLVVLTICRRESTILWGELFDKSGRVRDKVYVIPNALVPEHFQPGTLKTSDIGKTWLPVTLDSLTSSQWPLSFSPDLHTAKASISSSPSLPVSATPSRTSALSLVRTLLPTIPIIHRLPRRRQSSTFPKCTKNITFKVVSSS